VKRIKTEIVESTGNADNENHMPNTYLVNCSSITVINHWCFNIINANSMF